MAAIGAIHDVSLGRVIKTNQSKHINQSNNQSTINLRSCDRSILLCRFRLAHDFLKVASMKRLLDEKNAAMERMKRKLDEARAAGRGAATADRSEAARLTDR